MSFVISVDTARWRGHQDGVQAAISAAGATLVPVAKGNGYGLGNVRLAAEAARLGAGEVAVGTAHEAAAVLDSQPDLDVTVLEPVMAADPVAQLAWTTLRDHPGAARLIQTVSSLRGATALAKVATPDRPGRVILEGLTSMRRFGMTEDELASAIHVLAPAVATGAVRLMGLALHLPLATPVSPRVGPMTMLGDDPLPGPVSGGSQGSAKVREVVAWGLLWPTLLANLTGMSDAGSLWLSHLDDTELGQLQDALPDLPLALRVGTRLWLGDRGSLQARGTVLAVHHVTGVESAGYHQRAGPRDGHVVVVSGGTSHGVAMTAPRPGRSLRQRAASAGSGALEAAGRSRSPFHLPTGGHAWFLEPPHMHVSMLRIPRGSIPPPVGEMIDCDVRFTTVHPDAVLG